MASPEPRLGQTVADRYRLLSVLGRGGMGSIYEAEHLVTGRKVTLKLMHPSEEWSELAVARFLREARVVGAIAHPNIVEVLDAGIETDGAPFAAFTLLRGESVRAMLKRAGKLPPRQAVSIALDVLDALAAVHGAGVIHRDIKPDNVFLVPQGNRARAVLLDFGISKSPTTVQTSNIAP